MLILEIVKSLLSKGVNPNFSPPNQSDKPLLLAASMGNHEVLRVLKTRIKDQIKVRFDVWTKEYKSSVLHLVLKKTQVDAKSGRGRRKKDKEDAEQK